MISQYGPLIVGIASLLGGLWILIHTVRKLRRARIAGRHWGTVDGLVVKASKTVTHLSSPKSRNKRANTYLLDFGYQYAVDGKAYKSTKPRFFGLYLHVKSRTFCSSTLKAKKSRFITTPSNLKMPLSISRSPLKMVNIKWGLVPF